MNPFSRLNKVPPVDSTKKVEVLPPPVEKVPVAALSDMKDLNGLFFDASTGKVYKEDGTYSGFTFERPTWTGPFGLAISWPFLNPLSFATDETARKVRDIVETWLTTMPMNFVGWKVTVEEQKVTGPFTRTLERQIVIEKFGVSELHSAGMLANSIIRQGEEVAKKQFLAELRTAGFNI